MPRYFFHVRQEQTLIPDPEGADLPDLAAAEAEAVATAREILAERLRTGEIVDGSSFEIADEHGEVLSVVPFASVLRLH